MLLSCKWTIKPRIILKKYRSRADFKITFRVSIFFGSLSGFSVSFVDLLFLKWHFGLSQLSTVTAISEQLS